MWNPSKYYFKFNKACKLDEYFHIQNCSFEKCLIGKLALECEDEISNTTETLLNNKKVICEKGIHTILLIIICMLLSAVVSIGCYY